MPAPAPPGGRSPSRARITPKAAVPSWKRESRSSRAAEIRRMRMKRLFAALAAIALAHGAAAQNFPSKPITMVVGFEPGGGTDTVARILAKTLSDNVGQQVVVENRAGAGGNIAVDYVAKAAPDGYTVVLANVGALTVNPHMIKLAYDPLKDLAPITMAVVFPNVIVAHPRIATKTLAEYVKLAKEKPNTITY